MRKKEELKLLILAAMLFLFSRKGLTISIHSPKNATYYSGKIILNVSTDKLARWIGNSIDGGKVIIECEDCTGYVRYDLTFSEGNHTITVYAMNYNGKVTSASVEFVVKH